MAGKIVGSVNTNSYSGGEVSSFSLLVMGAGKRGSDNPNGFVKVSVFNQQSEFLNKFFKEGDWICVTGSLQQNSWKDKTDGSNRSELVVVSNKLGFPPGSKADKTESSDTPATVEATRKVGGKSAKSVPDADTYDPFAE